MARCKARLKLVDYVLKVVDLCIAVLQYIVVRWFVKGDVFKDRQQELKLLFDATRIFRCTLERLEKGKEICHSAAELSGQGDYGENAGYRTKIHEYKHMKCDLNQGASQTLTPRICGAAFAFFAFRELKSNL